MTDDDYRLLSYVRPPDWRNPEPAATYDLVVIGGGTAGLVAAAGAAGLGARVALVERHRLGGDCLNSGCVPSKALLHSARAGHDFATAMARLRARRADIAPHDSAERLASLGVDVFFGHARFTDARTVDVVDRERSERPDHAAQPARLRFRKCVIAVGSRPAIPPIPALSQRPFLTSDTVWGLSGQPHSMVVVGGGPIGCELAQAFARLGTRVTVFDAAPNILSREDGDAAQLIAERLAADGVMLRVGSMNRADDLPPADVVLVATGRAANVDGLGLDAAGIAHGPHGVTVDARLRTTNAAVYAAGDCASQFKFTHAADALARIAIQNALFFGRRRADALVIPWCTFTDPEVAHVGLNSAEAAQAGAGTTTVPLDDVDRAIVDDATHGFVRVHHAGGRIVGATIVAPHAGEMIGLLAYAMRHGHGPDALSATIFPYPTLSLALRQVGDAYRRARLTPRVKGLLRYYFGRRRTS